MVRRLWSELKDLNAKPVSRSMRRILLGIYMFTTCCYFATAVIALFPWHATSRLYGPAAFIWVSIAVVSAPAWMRLLRRTSFVTSWDERAQVDFGRDYSQLTRRQQFDVRARVIREMQQGGKPADERDSLMQREAEHRAFRALKVGLPIFVAAYWVVCLCLPAGPVRVGLLIGAVATSVTVVPVMILPDFIRLWTEPDDVGEPRAVSAEREA